MARVPFVPESEYPRAYEAAQCVVETHRRLSAWLEPGQTLAQIDRFVGQTLDELGCKSCFQGYSPGRMPAFPSHACLSVNECIVHGTAGYYEAPMKLGDVLKIDVGVWKQGWVGDAAWTYVFGPPTPEIKHLCDAGKDSIREGVKTLRPGNRYRAWAETVQRIVEHERGLHLVRGLGGHGYNKKRLHCEPFVANVAPSFPGEWPDSEREIRPGTIVAVEPMIAIGTNRTVQKSGQWPIFTADGSASVHYEHDVLITEEGPRLLTEGLEDIRDVIE